MPSMTRVLPLPLPRPLPLDPDYLLGIDQTKHKTKDTRDYHRHIKRSDLFLKTTAYELMKDKNAN